MRDSRRGQLDEYESLEDGLETLRSMQEKTQTLISSLAAPFLHEPDVMAGCDELLAMVEELRGAIENRIEWLDELDSPHFDLYQREPSHWKRTYSTPDSPERFPIRWVP